MFRKELLKVESISSIRSLTCLRILPLFVYTGRLLLIFSLNRLSLMHFPLLVEQVQKQQLLELKSYLPPREEKAPPFHLLLFKMDRNQTYNLNQMFTCVFMVLHHYLERCYYRH